VDDSRRARFEEVAPGLVEPVRRYLARRTDPDTAEDVLADTLLVVWRRTTELPDPVLPWVYGVAANCLRNADRSVRRQQRVAAKVATLDPPAATADPADAVLGDPDLEDALARLREEDLELVRLWAWEQLTPAEIGAALGISANAVSIRLSRARAKLRTHLLTVEGQADRKAGPAAGHEGP
jgi:RNA polymerase sigma-70 factor, ECF subfamily